MLYVYNDFMDVRWTPAKAKANFKKHGIRFSDAQAALFDPMAITIEDTHATGEQRHITTGLDHSGRLVTIVFTYREDHVRLISGRYATSKERKAYES